MTPSARRGPVAVLVASAAVCALAAPSLGQAASAGSLGSFAHPVSLAPLLVVLVLLWRRLRPAGTSSRRLFGRCLAVVAAGPVVALVLAVTVGASPVLPHPFVTAEIIGWAALEEVGFRGILLLLALRIGARLLPPPIAVVVPVLAVTVAFAAAHPDGSPYVVAERVWFGCLASALILRTGRLRLPIALHSAYNLYAYVALPLVPAAVVAVVGIVWTSSVTAALLPTGTRQLLGGLLGKPRASSVRGAGDGSNRQVRTRSRVRPLQSPRSGLKRL